VNKLEAGTMLNEKANKKEAEMSLRAIDILHK